MDPADQVTVAPWRQLTRPDSITADLGHGTPARPSAWWRAASAKPSDLGLSHQYSRSATTASEPRSPSRCNCPNGSLDQSAALLCRAGHALLIDCRTECTLAVPLDFTSARRCLMIVDTRVRHALTDGQYAERNRECAAAARALRVCSLRDAGEQQLASIPKEMIRRRARHVIQENRRVLKTAELLQDGQLPAIGKLMTGSHTSLRDDFQV
jgi:hypothetical protein